MWGLLITACKPQPGASEGPVTRGSVVVSKAGDTEQLVTFGEGEAAGSCAGSCASQEPLFLVGVGRAAVRKA